MYRELNIAVDYAKELPPEKTWIIPIKINECKIPDIEIRSGEKFSDLHRINLFPNFEKGIKSIVDTVKIEYSKTMQDNKTNKHGKSQNIIEI